MTPTPNILAQILAHKKQEVEHAEGHTSLQQLKAQITRLPILRPFQQALIEKIAKGQPGIIAEIKKASPSQGVIREDFDPVAIAKSYEENGATCLSVLTDKKFFQGHADFLLQAKEATSLPVLRKDFIVDPYQIYESRAIGADCILLIVSALDPAQLIKFNQLARELQLDVLLEIHNQVELAIAVSLGNQMIAINNRDLNDFSVSLSTSIRLAKEVPLGRTLISESGIHTPADVALLRKHHIHGFLIGEGLMRAPNPGTKLKELFYAK